MNNEKLEVEDSLFIIFSIDAKRALGRYIEMIYTTKGLFDLNEINLSSDEVHLVAGKIGPFETIESLTQFSYKLSDKNKIPSICLCSSEAVNKALLESSNISDLNCNLQKEGDILVNPDNKKHGIFSSFLR